LFQFFPHHLFDQDLEGTRGKPRQVLTKSFLLGQNEIQYLRG